MARRYFGWTSVKFRKFGHQVRRYRRYGKKTYRTHNFYRSTKPSTSRGFKDYV